MRNRNQVNNEYVVWCPLIGAEGGYVKVIETQDLRLFVDTLNESGQKILKLITQAQFNNWDRLEPQEKVCEHLIDL